MYVVVKIKDQQYRVEAEERLRVPLLDNEIGETVTFEEVLLYSNGDDLQVGDPVLSNCSVSAEVLRHDRDRKVIVFKKKRRKNYRRKRGHRQLQTVLRIRDIAVA